MNCQDHLYYGRNPREITRRWFSSNAALPANTTPTQRATYTVASRVLLNFDER